MVQKYNFKTRAPFGIGTVRFNYMGMHPHLDKSGIMKKHFPTGPGSYDPELCGCIYKKYNVGNSSWKRKADVEEFSQNLGFRNTYILKERRFRQSLGGPGCYDISDEIYKKQTSSCMSNVGFGKQKRFPETAKSSNPPPGLYFKNLDELSEIGAGKQFSNLPTFERDGFVDRFKDTKPPYTKPPNLYNPKDYGGIDALLKKKVSKRGPYDLFTGPRDGSTIKNHFSPSKFKGVDGFYSVVDSIDILLHHPTKERSGKFLQEARFHKGTLRHMIDDLTICFRDPDEPGPFHYDRDLLTEFRENMYPFNMSIKDARPPIKWKIYPGVGRYNPKLSVCDKKKQESWMFKSKCGRTKYEAVEYNAF